MFGSAGSGLEVTGSRPFRYLSTAHGYAISQTPRNDAGVRGGGGGQDKGVGRRVIYQQQQQTCRQKGSYYS